jgi:tetratricopeptide (TPR) repeat protein
MKSETNNLSLVEIIEIGSVIGSIGGTIASLITQQFFLASIPLSVAVSLNLFNRRQLLNSIDTKNQEQFALLNTEHQTYSTNLEDLSQLIDKQERHLTELQQNYQQTIQEIKESNEKLEEEILDVQINKTPILTVDLESVSSNSKSAEFLCQQGIKLQEQDPHEALEKFAKAIHFDPQYADAYYHRGLVLFDLEENKKAIKDFRLAAKWYFQQGNLENYQKAKDMEIKLHSLNSPVRNKPQKPSENIRLSNLFS